MNTPGLHYMQPIWSRIRQKALHRVAIIINYILYLDTDHIRMLGSTNFFIFEPRSKQDQVYIFSQASQECFVWNEISTWTGIYLSDVVISESESLVMECAAELHVRQVHVSTVDSMQHRKEWNRFRINMHKVPEAKQVTGSSPGLVWNKRKTEVSPAQDQNHGFNNFCTFSFSWISIFCIEV